MNKQEIITQLNKNRKTKLIKDSRPKIDVLSIIKVAVSGSEFFYENIAIISVGDNFYWKEYTENLPTTLIGSVCLSKEDAMTIIGVMKGYQKYKHYHINPYTWLITGCLYQGLDLVKEKLIDL